MFFIISESGNITPGKIICINRSHPDCISESLDDTIKKYNDVQKSGLVVISFKAFEWAYHIQTIQIDLISGSILDFTFCLRP